MTYKLTDEQRAFVLLARELGRKRALLPDEQRVLLDSPKFNGPIGQLAEGDDAAAPTEADQLHEDSVVAAPDQTKKP